jgi:hypothetical protein
MSHTHGCVAVTARRVRRPVGDCSASKMTAQPDQEQACAVRVFGVTLHDRFTAEKWLYLKCLCQA